MPRGIRGRLILIYTTAAIVLAALGGGLFAHQLATGVQGNLDTLLSDRADDLVTSLQAMPSPALAESPSGTFSASVESVTQLYRPDASLAGSDPADVPALVSADVLAAAQGGAGRGGAAKAGAPQLHTVTYDGVRFRLRVVAFAPQGSTGPSGQWVVLVGGSLAQAEDAVGDIKQAIFIATPLALVAVAVGAWLLSGAALGPVERMRKEAAQLAKDSPTPATREHRLTVPDTGDELEALGATLNELLTMLQTSLRQQRDFVADAGHELRTPLTVLRTELDLADRPSRTREQLFDSVRQASAEVDRLIALSDSLLQLATAEQAADGASARAVDVVPALQDALRAWRDQAATRHTALTGDWPGSLRCAISPAGLRQVLDNLIANALRYAQGGSVRISAGPTGPPAPSAERAAGEPGCRIVVADDGPGFPPDFLPHALERFRRSDAARSRSDGPPGAGLGLAIVAAIVRNAGGRVELRNGLLGGAEVTVLLRGAAEAASGAASSADATVD
jgi:signal transduction histidine kinase